MSGYQFDSLSLADLEAMLRDMIRFGSEATRTDVFCLALVDEIARRKRGGLWAMEER